jgi:23S rRNA pseudouridine1911/1915/1917 synthase
MDFKRQITAADLKSGKPTRLDSLLADLTKESRSFIQTQVEKSAIRINGKAAKKPGQLVREGDEVDALWIRPDPTPGVHPSPGNLEILYEDATLLVLNKPQGLVVHPAPSHSGDTLVHHLLHHFEEDLAPQAEESDRPGIVHRLDKGTSGVMLVAKERKAQESLSEQFKAREIKKQYEAVVWGKLAGKGRFQSVIGRDRTNRLKQSSRTSKGRDAITDWKAEKVFTHFTHVQLFPYTGRTHQLRVHLAESQHPIVGDPLYGRGMTAARKKDLPIQIVPVIESLEATLLHAKEIRFQHPVSHEPMHFAAPRPSVFDDVIRLLTEYDK